MNWILLLTVAGCFSSCFASSLRHPHRQENVNGVERGTAIGSRYRRDGYNTIEECMTVTSKAGGFFFKTNPKSEDLIPGRTCGVFFITDPDRLIEIELVEIDLPCENDGLISVVDGWELNGEFFPSPADHPLPLKDRVASQCGSRRLNKHFVSSQNAAVVQFRVPTYGQGFFLRVRYVKNSQQPCNILVEGTSNIYTLSNQGRRVNCSITTLFPASVSLLFVEVGGTPSEFPLSRTAHYLMGQHQHTPYHQAKTVAEDILDQQCEERGMQDYLQVGGSFGLDSRHLMVADSLCGVKTGDLKSVEQTIACDITTVRLVSSGHHRNRIQVEIRPALEEDLFSASFMCAA